MRLSYGLCQPKWDIASRYGTTTVCKEGDGGGEQMIGSKSLSRDGRIQKAAGVWAEYVKAKRGLLEAGLIRSFKAAEADFAEWLVVVLFDGELPPSKSHVGYDVIAGNRRIQVKSIAKMPDNPSGYIIGKKDRSNDRETGATHYVFVFFDELIPDAIFPVKEAFVRQFPKAQIKRPRREDANSKVEVDLNVFRCW